MGDEDLTEELILNFFFQGFEDLSNFGSAEIDTNEDLEIDEEEE